MITVKRLTLEDAVVLLAAAEAKARAIGVTETICVCDDGGHPIALHRMTGARITGVEIAIAKAFTAAAYSLADGQVIKNVAPPWLRGRADAYRRLTGGELTKGHPNGPDLWILTFNPQDNSLKGDRYSTGSPTYPVRDVLVELVSLWPQDLDLPRGLLSKPVTGDWVFRMGALRDELIAGLLA